MSDNQSLARIEPMPAAPTVEAMITLAIEKGASVDTLERLMAIRREVRAEQAKEAYDRALADFQSECPTIQKTAKVMNKDGRSVRYQYAPLDAIIHQVKGLLQKHGFSYTVNAKAEPTCVTAVCKLTHAYGHSDSSEFAVPIDKDAYMNPAQQVASALTFAKRYAFCNACGIMTGDADDDSISSHDDPKTPSTGTAKRPGSGKPEPGNRGQKENVLHTIDKPKETPKATEKTRAWFLAEMRKLFPEKAILQWAVDHVNPTYVMPHQGLDDFSLLQVPTSREGLAEKIKECAEFMGVEPTPQPGESTQTPAGASRPPTESAGQASGASQRQPEANTPPESESSDLPQYDENGDLVETIVGKLEAVSEKSGSSKKGPWTRYGLKVGSDWFNTFSKPLGECAKQDKGHTVRICFKRGEKGNELISLERAKSS